MGNIELINSVLYKSYQSPIIGSKSSDRVYQGIQELSAFHGLDNGGSDKLHKDIIAILGQNTGANDTNRKTIGITRDIQDKMFSILAQYTSRNEYLSTFEDHIYKKKYIEQLLFNTDNTIKENISRTKDKKTYSDNHAQIVCRMIQHTISDILDKDQAMIEFFEAYMRQVRIDITKQSLDSEIKKKQTISNTYFHLMSLFPNIIPIIRTEGNITLQAAKTLSMHKHIEETRHHYKEHNIIYPDISSIYYIANNKKEQLKQHLIGLCNTSGDHTFTKIVFIDDRLPNLQAVIDIILDNPEKFGGKTIDLYRQLSKRHNYGLHQFGGELIYPIQTNNTLENKTIALHNIYKALKGIVQNLGKEYNISIGLYPFNSCMELANNVEQGVQPYINMITKKLFNGHELTAVFNDFDGVLSNTPEIIRQYQNNINNKFAIDYRHANPPRL